MKENYVDPQEFKEDVLQRVSEFVDNCIRDNELYEVDAILEIIMDSSLTPNLIFVDVKDLLTTFNLVKQDLDSINEEPDGYGEEDLTAVNTQMTDITNALTDLATQYISEKSLTVTPEELVNYWINNGYGAP